MRFEDFLRVIPADPRGIRQPEDNLNEGDIRKLFDYSEEELVKLGDSSMKEKSVLIEIFQLLQL